MQTAPELLPDMSEHEIADRCKASALAKALLCAQVLSFCGSCVARLQQRLPLSLVEVTTLAHSLCALAAYTLWWAKP